MCMAYSGRCLLSSHMTGRSANSGDCAHSCRWKYRLALEERERSGQYFPIEEEDGYTTILSSADLCMIDHLQSLVDSGVSSLKIEGRMKSAYYVAVVTRAYRKALDALLTKDEGWREYRYITPHIPFIEDDAFTLLDEEFNVVLQADHPKRYYLQTNKAVAPGAIIRRISRPHEQTHR